MDDLKILKDEYPGESAWEKFAAVFLPGWSKRSDKAKYLAEIEDEETAAVIATSLGEDGLPWFGRRIGALGGRSPKEVLRDHPQGKTIIRSLIMRMPQ